MVQCDVIRTSYDNERNRGKGQIFCIYNVGVGCYKAVKRFYTLRLEF